MTGSHNRKGFTRKGKAGRVSRVMPTTAKNPPSNPSPPPPSGIRNAVQNAVQPNKSRIGSLLSAAPSLESPVSFPTYPANPHGAHDGQRNLLRDEPLADTWRMDYPGLNSDGVSNILLVRNHHDDAPAMLRGLEVMQDAARREHDRSLEWAAADTGRLITYLGNDLDEPRMTSPEERTLINRFLNERLAEYRNLFAGTDLNQCSGDPEQRLGSIDGRPWLNYSGMNDPREESVVNSLVSSQPGVDGALDAYWKIIYESLETTPEHPLHAIIEDVCIRNDPELLQELTQARTARPNSAAVITKSQTDEIDAKSTAISQLGI